MAVRFRALNEAGANKHRWLDFRRRRNTDLTLPCVIQDEQSEDANEEVQTKFQACCKGRQGRGTAASQR